MCSPACLEFQNERRNAELLRFRRSWICGCACTGRCWRFAFLKPRSTISIPARSCRGSLISTSAKKPSPSASARPCDRRLHHEHTPWPWPLCGERRRLDRMFAELLGKEAGLLQRQGRLHAHRRSRIPEIWERTRSSVEVRASPPGQRFPQRRQGNDRVAVCFFGEGALGQGSALRSHEHGRVFGSCPSFTFARTISTTNTRTIPKPSRVTF